MSGRGLVCLVCFNFATPSVTFTVSFPAKVPASALSKFAATSSQGAVSFTHKKSPGSATCFTSPLETGRIVLAIAETADSRATFGVEEDSRGAVEGNDALFNAKEPGAVSTTDDVGVASVFIEPRATILTGGKTSPATTVLTELVIRGGVRTANGAVELSGLAKAEDTVVEVKVDLVAATSELEEHELKEEELAVNELTEDGADVSDIVEMFEKDEVTTGEISFEEIRLLGVAAGSAKVSEGDAGDVEGATEATLE